MAQQPIVIHA